MPLAHQRGMVPKFPLSVHFVLHKNIRSIVIKSVSPRIVPLQFDVDCSYVSADIIARHPDISVHPDVVRPADIPRKRRKQTQYHKPIHTIYFSLILTYQSFKQRTLK
jgi:hypothetical protein